MVVEDPCFLFSVGIDEDQMGSRQVQGSLRGRF